jgi:predicted nucleic acid-binding protein
MSSKIGEAHEVHLGLRELVNGVISELITKQANKQSLTPSFFTLALLQKRSNIKLISEISKDKLTISSKVVNHPGDARVVASAWSSDVDYFMTLDQVHFLKSRKLRKLLPFHVATPGDFLSWLKEKLLGEK